MKINWSGRAHKFSNSDIKCPDIFEQNPELLKAVIENIVIIRGNVNNPGIYLWDSNENLKQLFE